VFQLEPIWLAVTSVAYSLEQNLLLGFVVLFLPLVSGMLSGMVAQQKGHAYWVWLGIGIITGPLGLIASAGLPDRILRRHLGDKI
jgi:hypothetical protein